MPTKLQTVEEQLRERTEKLWKEPEEYISLLETASRLYKYSERQQENDVKKILMLKEISETTQQSISFWFFQIWKATMLSL